MEPACFDAVALTTCCSSSDDRMPATLSDHGVWILFIRRRINNKDLAWGWSSRREHVPHSGGKDAAISRTEFAALTIHLGDGRALKQVADLLDVGMRVG